MTQDEYLFHFILELYKTSQKEFFLYLLQGKIQEKSLHSNKIFGNLQR